MNYEDKQDSMIGRRVGVFELKREIGRGGMGAVYLAERADGEFDQTVAVKLVKRGMDTDLILKRFRRERQILAALSHPNIAYFLGGGSTSDGLPYFVMEFIDGKPLYQFCDENHLGIKERLRVFQQICDAVEAAHEIQVIHRDLKPSNILVKADGKPKLLDFGIAKVFDSELEATEIEPTATQMRVMTPEYASPEQVCGGEVSPATDVYSLGMILYELLTGHRPYYLKRKLPHEAARIICNEEPIRPSSLAVRPASEMNEPQNSYHNGERIAFDLEKIILKALRKNPQERYQTAALLFEDIENYLENRPVSAEFFETVSKQTQAKNETRSIAILPLKSMFFGESQTSDDQYLSIGLADALIARLTNIRRIVVRPTSSVLRYADVTANPFEAGRELGVDYILEGNFRRVGDRIRVTIQLLSVSENATRWAEKFDENFTNVLEIEDVIAERVANLLLPQLTGEEKQKLEKRGTNIAEAYQAYMRGRYLQNRFTDEGLLKAVEAFREAIALDPNYALPHVGITDFYIWGSIFGSIPSNVGFPQAKESARRALEIDNESSEAYAQLAFATLLYDWNWTEAEKLVQRSLEINPNNGFAHECYSNFFCSQGRFDEAVVEIKRAEELDPLAPKAMLMTCWTLYQTRSFSKSAAKARKALEMFGDFPQANLHLGNSLTQAGKTAESVKVLRKAVELWQDSAMPRFMLIYALIADGNLEEAVKVLNDIKDLTAKGYVKSYFVAMAHVALGEFDEAVKWFEKSLEERNEWLIWFGVDPKLDRFRKDPRYLQILKQTNNPLFETQAHSSFKETTTGGSEKSIAVLPFKFISAANTGSEDEYLGFGLADALTMRLSNVRRFLVRPTSSVMNFGKHDVEPFEVGRKLGVDFIVDGNIRRVGDRIRVAAQLLNVGESSTFWAKRFDEDYTDVLALEDSISERVSRSLLPRLTGEDERQLLKRGTNNAEAHEAYLRGRFFWNQFTPESFPKAFEQFEKAVKLDPNYALAYTGIADFYTWASIFGMIPSRESHPKVFEALSRALAIDDQLAEVHAAFGIYHGNFANWEKCEAHHKRAIELNPNYSLAHEWYAALLVGHGRFEEGMNEIRLAEQLDPFSLRAKTLTAWTAYQARFFDEALEKAKEIIELDPNLAQGYLQAGNILLEVGEIEKALEYLRKGVELMPLTVLPVYDYCFALVANGKNDEARTQLAKLKEAEKTQYVMPFFVAMTHLALGELDESFEYFNKAVEEQSGWTNWFASEPKLKIIHNDPRYDELLKKLNLPKIA
ncbi:MAG TPA: protein kinase [Pyrinomonadaceae bacterium]|nr:protein kinase [Pyrinomonadaceae bacterium]